MTTDEVRLQLRRKGLQLVWGKELHYYKENYCTTIHYHPVLSFIIIYLPLIAFLSYPSPPSVIYHCIIIYLLITFLPCVCSLGRVKARTRVTEAAAVR